MASPLLGMFGLGARPPQAQGGYRDPAAHQRWQDLYMARQPEGVNRSRLAPVEHGAFAESLVRERPVAGTLSMLASIPAYNAGKAVGVLPSEWSKPGVDSLAEAYRGLGRGLGANFGDFLSRLVGDRPPAAMPPSQMPHTMQMNPAELQALLHRYSTRPR